MEFRAVKREDFVIGNTYFDIADTVENGAESFVYIGVFDQEKYGKCHFMYPLSESGYPEIEADGTVAFGITGADFNEEV